MVYYCVVWVGKITTPVHSLCLEVKAPATKGDRLKLPLFNSTWNEVR